jgi:hypothetical protein
MRRRGISRRALLSGGGLMFGLPLFESLVPRSLRAQAEVAPVRLVYLYLPNGVDMATFRPEATGAGYATPPMMLGMEAVKSEFSVVTGLENRNGRPDEIGDHASGTGSFITCAHANKSETEIFVGVSADQIAAQALGAETRLPSLQLGIDGGGGSGDCDNGYSCAYTRNISWSGPSTPLPKIVDPQQAFEQLFAGYDPGESDAEAARRRAYEQSVIDAVLGDANSLRGKLGATDQKKLDEYLSGVRELEKRVADLGPQVTCDPGEPPPSDDDLDYPAHIAAMFDLIVLALSCDATRIVTFMFGNAISGRTHPFLGITGGHHDISHHGDDPALIAQLAQIGRWEMDQLAYFFSRLKETPDVVPGQDLLYNSAIFCSSDISDGNRHNHDDMPIIMGGHAGGAFTPGRHIEFPTNQGEEDERVANLLVTMLATAGVEGAQLGDSTGPLTGL